MTIKILHDPADETAVIYDNSTELPISRIIYSRLVKKQRLTASEVCERYLAWSTTDLRTLTVLQQELHWAAFQEYLDLDPTHEIIGGK